MLRRKERRVRLQVMLCIGRRFPGGCALRLRRSILRSVGAQRLELLGLLGMVIPSGLLHLRASRSALRSRPVCEYDFQVVALSGSYQRPTANCDGRRCSSCRGISVVYGVWRRVRLSGLVPCTNSISRWLRSPQQGYDKYWFGVSATGSALYGNATSTNVQTAHGVAFGFDVLPQS